MVVVMQMREELTGAEECRDRDQELVRAIGRYGAMTMAQAQRAMGAGRTVTYRHFRRCEEAGLVERLRIPGSGPAVLHATREGLRYAGLGLPLAAVSPGGVDHMLRCTEVAIRAGQHFGHDRILTEREIVLAEAIEERPIASVQIGSFRGNPKMHRADLAILWEGEGTLAVEVELTPKAPQRLRRIIAAWLEAVAGAGQLVAVDYVCAAGQTRRAVERAVAKVGGGRSIRVLGAPAL